MHLTYKKYDRICVILTRLNGVLHDDVLVNWIKLLNMSIHLAVVFVGGDTKISFPDGDRMYPSFKPLVRNPKLFETIDYSNLNNYEVVSYYINDDIYGVIFENSFPLASFQHRCVIKRGALINYKMTDSKTLWDKFEDNLLICQYSNNTMFLEII